MPIVPGGTERASSSLLIHLDKVAEPRNAPVLRGAVSSRKRWYGLTYLARRVIDDDVFVIRSHRPDGLRFYVGLILRLRIYSVRAFSCGGDVISAGGLKDVLRPGDFLRRIAMHGNENSALFATPLVARGPILWNSQADQGPYQTAHRATNAQAR